MPQDETLQEHWGSQEKYSGAPSHGWPGSCGEPPLVIPADHFCFVFQSDSTTQAWGYRVEVTAPVCPSTVVSLSNAGWAGVAQLAAGRPVPDAVVGGHARIPMSWSECAVAAGNNNVGEAARWLLDHKRQVGAGEESPRAAMAALSDGMSRRGLYRDSTGNLEVNVQTAEVGEARSLLPVAELCWFAHADSAWLLRLAGVHSWTHGSPSAGARRRASGFQSRFRRTQCTATLRNGVHQLQPAVAAAVSVSAGVERGILLRAPQLTGAASSRVVVLCRDGKVYDVKGWSPVTQHATRPAGDDRQDSGLVSKAGKSEPEYCVNMPRKCGYAVSFMVRQHRPVFRPPYACASRLTGLPVLEQGEEYTHRYERGSLLWISTYFDGMLDEAIDQSPVSEKPIVWVCPRLYAWRKTREALGTASIERLRPQADGLLGRLVMWVPPAGDLDTRRDSVGAYFEIQVLSGRQVLHGFHLLDHGRTAQRCLVFTTDYRCVRLDLVALLRSSTDTHVYRHRVVSGTRCGTCPRR